MQNFQYIGSDQYVLVLFSTGALVGIFGIKSGQRIFIASQSLDRVAERDLRIHKLLLILLLGKSKIRKVWPLLLVILW